MIRKANPADKPKVADILTKSFSDNQSVRFVTGDSPPNKDKVKALMEYAFDMCDAFGEVWVTDNLHACALIIHPERKKKKLKAILLDLRLIWKCIGLFNLTKVLKREAHVKSLQVSGYNAYLWFIGVDPAHQHRGIVHRCYPKSSMPVKLNLAKCF